MKIQLLSDPQADDITVQITCPKLTPEVEQLLFAIRILNRQLSVKCNKETYLLDLHEIIFIESVERNCFIYTAQQVYESNQKLYELEHQLKADGFCRISKSCLIQMRHIRSLKADINHKIRITMNNGEQLIASRQYAEALKQKLGVI